MTKMLLSAAKINKAGYDIHLDQRAPMISNAKTGEKIHLMKRNGVFVMDMWIDTEKMGQVFSRPERE